MAVMQCSDDFDAVIQPSVIREVLINDGNIWNHLLNEGKCFLLIFGDVDVLRYEPSLLCSLNDVFCHVVVFDDGELKPHKGAGW